MPFSRMVLTVRYLGSSKASARRQAASRRWAETPGEPDDALCGAQVVQDAVSEQPLDLGVTARPDVLAETVRISVCEGP